MGRLIGCHCQFWNKALQLGPVLFLTANIVCFVGIFCFTCCFGELASALPFTGGNYGFVRGLISPYIGFFVGYFEIINNFATIGALTLVFGSSVATALSLPTYHQLCFYPIPFLFAAYLQCRGSHILGKVSVILVIYSLLLFAIFLFGSFAEINVEKYNVPVNTGSTNDYFSFFKHSGLFFMGFETLPVISSEAQKVKKKIMIFFVSKF